MNKKITMYSPPFPRLKNYRDVIDLAAEYGIGTVEPFGMFEFENPDTDVAHRIREYADERNIKFPCFSVYTTIVDTDIKETTERLKRYAEVAAILGSPYLHHTIVGEVRNPDKVVPHKKELLKKGIDFVRDIYDYAETLGVKTVYEDQGYIFNGVEGFGNFLAGVNRDVGVVADFGNIYHAGDCIEDFVNAFADRVVHVHIKDLDVSDTNENGGSLTLDGKYIKSVEIGTGCIDCKGVVDMLKKRGYDGYYSLEYAVLEDDSPIIKKAFEKIGEWLI